MVDLQGPKIRLGTFPNGPVVARRWVRSSPSPSTTCPATARSARRPTRACPATSTSATRSSSTTARSRSRPLVTGPPCAPAWSRAGASATTRASTCPGVAVRRPAMSDKDVADLRWALRLGVDIDRAVVRAARRRPADVVRIMDDDVGVRLPVLAKIEKPQAVDNLEVDRRRLRRDRMVARGISRRRAAARAGAAGAEARGHPRPSPRQAGHRRHPDARLDGVDDAPHARRGQRRRERRARRRRRAHALRRDLGGRTRTTSCARWRASSRAGRGEALDQLPQIVDRNDSTSRSITRAAVNVGIDVGASRGGHLHRTSRSARLVALPPNLPLMAFTPNPRVRSQLALC